MAVGSGQRQHDVFTLPLQGGLPSFEGMEDPSLVAFAHP
jgi:hypothetical protein